MSESQVGPARDMRLRARLRRGFRKRVHARHLGLSACQRRWSRRARRCGASRSSCPRCVRPTGPTMSWWRAPATSWRLPQQPQVALVSRSGRLHLAPVWVANVVCVCLSEGDTPRRSGPTMSPGSASAGQAHVNDAGNRESQAGCGVRCSHLSHEVFRSGTPLRACLGVCVPLHGSRARHISPDQASADPHLLQSRSMARTSRL